jgi:hypothetical protein
MVGQMVRSNGITSSKATVLAGNPHRPVAANLPRSPFREAIGHSISRFASRSRENQRQEILLEPSAFLGSEILELDAHAIRPDGSNH